MNTAVHVCAFITFLWLIWSWARMKAERNFARKTLQYSWTRPEPAHTTLYNPLALAKDLAAAMELPYHSPPPTVQALWKPTPLRRISLPATLQAFAPLTRCCEALSITGEGLQLHPRPAYQHGQPHRKALERHTAHLTALLGVGVDLSS